MDDMNEQVRRWLDPAMISKVEELDDENHRSLGVVAADASLKLSSLYPDGPIVLTSKMELDPGLLSHFQEDIKDEGLEKYEVKYLEGEERNLQNMIISVLTNASGHFVYLNEDGETCDFDEMRMIQLKYRIYPDGRFQHTLMNGITEQASALDFINDLMSQHESDMKEGS